MAPQKCTRIEFWMEDWIPVSSIPGSSYYNLNKFLTPLFDKVPGANIETSMLSARRKLESITLGLDESIVSLDLNSLYTNVLVNDAIETALRSLYSGDHATEMITLEASCAKCLFLKQ